MEVLPNAGKLKSCQMQARGSPAKCRQMEVLSKCRQMEVLSKCRQMEVLSMCRQCKSGKTNLKTCKTKPKTCKTNLKTCKTKLKNCKTKLKKTQKKRQKNIRVTLVTIYKQIQMMFVLRLKLSHHVKHGM